MSKVTRCDIIDKIIEERENQLNNPNSNTDLTKTKNDWTSLAGYYLFDSAYKDSHVSFEEFRKSLITASAVLLAALETSYSLEEGSTTEELLSKLDNLNDEQE